MPHRLLPCLQVEAELMELNKEALKQLAEKERPYRPLQACKGIHCRRPNDPVEGL